MENFWKEPSFSDVLRITIGKTFKEFDEEWLYSLKKEYYPLLASRDQPSQVTRKVAREGFNAKPVVFEHDSTREVYFIGNRTGYTGIFRKNLDDPDPEADADNVIEGEQIGRIRGVPPVPQPDRRLSARPSRLRHEERRDAMPCTLRCPRRRTRHDVPVHRLVSIGSTSWAPDGRRVAFSAIDARDRMTCTSWTRSRAPCSV